LLASWGAAVALVARAASAQEPAEPPSGASIPSGAAGAVVVPPKPDDSAPPPAPKKPVLVPPKVKTDEGATYPQQAIADGVDQPVTVVVIVEVDKDGHVTAARPETPQGHGFDEAAVDAARRLVFDPATRDGAPTRAIVKHAYVFTPPPARLSGRVLANGVPLAGAEITARGPEPGRSFRAPPREEHVVTSDASGAWRVDRLAPGTYHVTIRAPGMKTREADETVGFGEEASSVDRLEPEAPAAAAPDGGVPEAEDVYVRAKRPPRDVTVHSLDQRELDRIPGTGGDALRGLLNLPGVARPPGIAGLLIVRGSAPQDTQVFVDGTLVPLVYHFGGLSSVVPTEMISKIDFYPGNYSAQYGRGMGGIVDVGLREPRSDKLHGLAQVDLIDARVLAEGPIGNTGWTFAVGGRRSYVDLWLKPVLEQSGAGVTAAPVYYDYQALAERDWDHHRQSFRVAFFGSDDKLAIILKDVNASDPTLGGGISSHTGFWRGQVRYENKFSDTTSLRLVGAIGQDFVEISVGDIYFDITGWPISSRVELAQKLAPDATMNVGLDMYYEPYTVNARLPPPNPVGQPPPGPLLAKPPVTLSDTDQIYRPGFYDEMELTPWKGGRLVPGLRLDYAKDTKSWDFAPRAMARQDLTSGFPRTTLKGAAGLYFQPPQPQETNPVFGQPGVKSNRATEYDVGLEQEITRHVEASLDGFYKQLDDLVVAGNFNNGTGRAFGLETLIRWKPDARFFGWLAYTLSRSELRDGAGLPVHLSPFDQTHILTTLGSYRLGRGWELGARFRLVSGNPYTPRTYGFFDENNAAYLPLTQYPPNGARLPLFHQLDIRVDKTWVFTSWRLSAYLDVQNVYNQGNVEGISYNYNNTLTSYATGLPFLPSIGLRGEL
jgi:TonB family protein